MHCKQFPPKKIILQSDDDDGDNDDDGDFSRSCDKSKLSRQSLVASLLSRIPPHLLPMDGCHCERSIYRSLPHQYCTMRRRRRRMSQVRGIIRNVSETLVAIEEVGWQWKPSGASRWYSRAIISYVICTLDLQCAGHSKDMYQELVFLCSIDSFFSLALFV